MPGEDINSLIQAYSNKPVVLEPQQEKYVPITDAPGVSIADYQKIVDSGKSWFSENLSFDIDDQKAVFGRTPEQLEFEQEYYQSVGEKLGAGVLRTVNKFASEIVKMPGYVGGMTAAAFTDASIGEALDNWWVNGVQEWENYANNDLLKVYTPDSVKNGGLWANLSSASFWATEGADGIGFLTSMLVPGNALKLLKLGQRGVNLYNASNAFLRTSKGLAKGLTKTQSLRYAAQADKLGMRAARNFDDFTAATVNATLEASAEAKESFDSSLDSLVSSYMENNNIEDASQIDSETMMDLRLRAGEVSANVFKFNMAILMVPNLMDQKALFGAFGSRKSGLGKLFNEQGVLQDFTAKTLKQKSLGYLGVLGKGLIKEGFFEEGMQFTAAEYYKEQSELPDDPDKKDETAYQQLGGLLNSYVDNLDSVDMRKAIALGGILGGGMSVIGKYKTDAYETKYGSQLHAQLKNNLIDRVKGIADIFEKNEKGIIFENGKPKINEAKFQDLLQQPENKITLNKLADIAALSGNKEDYTLIQSILDYNYFQPFFEQGQQGIDILKNHISGELSRSELEKQDVEELLGLTGSKTNAQRMSELLQRVDDFYQLYDNVDNRHEFDMPSLEGGKRSDKAEFSQLIRNKKLEKVIFNSELQKINSTLNQKVFSIISKNLVNQDDPTTPANLSESDKKQLEVLYGKEAQYKKMLEDKLEEEKSLYSKEAIQEEYAKFLANKDKKELEKKESEYTDEQIKDKFAKDLANAGYVMDREHSLDPDKKSKLTPEELEKFKGQDKSFYFELNGKEYEAYSQKDPATGTYKRVYRDAVSKQVMGEFTLEFLKKNRSLRIIGRAEALDKRKLEKLRKSKIAKLRAFRDVFDNLNKDFIQNEKVFNDLYNKRSEIREEIEIYTEWLKSISYPSGMALKNKSEEKKQILAEIKRLEKILEDLDQQIEDLNNIYGSVSEQFDLLSQIKDEFEIFKEDGMFKSEQPDILLSKFASDVKKQIDLELEQLMQEEADLNEMLNKAEQAVVKAEQELNDANELKTEIEIIAEDLKRVRDINKIIKLLLTSDFRKSDRLRVIAARFKPLGFILNEVEKLRDSTITDEQYLKIITVANNLLSDTYLSSGFTSLENLLSDIEKSLAGVTKLPLSSELEYYVENYYSIPTKVADSIVKSKQNILNAANVFYENALGKKYSFEETQKDKLDTLQQRETVLSKLMKDLYVGYRKYLNKTPYQKISVNNQAPENQEPTVYDEDSTRINVASFLSDFVFRNIGLDVEYEKDKDNENYGKTIYPKDNEGLPKLNENDENYRRLAQFINKNPNLPYTHNARFFIARTDSEGNTSINLGGGQTSAELQALYESIPEDSGRPRGDISIGFYLVDKDGNVASEEYNNRTAPVMGFIPRKITDENGRLRINNATAISILTNFDIRDKDKFKYINEYALSSKEGVYTFNATKKDYIEGKEIETPSNISVTIVDGKAVITAKFADFLPGEGNVKITSEDAAKKIAQLLAENTRYSLSRAGKMVQAILMDSEVKYHNYVKLVNTKTKFIENEGVIEKFGEITIEDLIQKATDIFKGTEGRPGLYQTSVIEPLINHIETEGNPAFVGINKLTKGIPLIQYETNDKGEPMFNRPLSNKVTKVFNIKIDGQKIKGGQLEVVDTTNVKDLGTTPGKVVLRLKNDVGNFTGEVVPLQQRTLNSDEMLTALFIMSNADEPGLETPEFGTTKDGKNKFFLSFYPTKDKRRSVSKMRMLPFNQESTVSAITSLIYWGQHNKDKFYTDAQGNVVPVRSGGVGEIFSHDGKIFFKKKLDDNTWVDTFVEIQSIKEALDTKDPLNNSGIYDLVSFLSDKRLNVNKQLLTDNSSMYFHPTVVKTEKGYTFEFKPYDNYQSFLLKDALTTSAPVKENFPKFGNRMIVFKSENRVKPKLSDKFVNPKEEVGPKEPKKKARAKKEESAEPKTEGKKSQKDLFLGDIDKEKLEEARKKDAAEIKEVVARKGKFNLESMISGNLVKEGEESSSSAEAAAENELSPESKSSLASMFGQKQQAVPEAQQSNRPKNLFNDVDTSGSSITGDPKVDKTIEDQKNNCPPN
jgi:hypothetical protein